MKNFGGNPEFPIWLIGDSPPEAWVDKLDTPLDSRHPARHNIWTSVLDPLQDRLYRQRKLRLDTSRLYIRNVFNQPIGSLITQEQLSVSRKTLKATLDNYKPSIVLTFGILPFQISRLAYGETLSDSDIAKNTRLLGEQFRSRIQKFDDNKVNIIPLLHTSIARRHFLSAHRDFVGNYGQAPPNYFDYVGTMIADLLLAKLSNKPIWIE